MALVALIGRWTAGAAGQTATPTPPEPLKLVEPKPLVPGVKVVTLWPAGSPMLKALAGWDKPEVFNMSRGRPERVESVVNIHNPSIEVHLAPPEKANGMAVIVAAGGGNTTCNVGPEGTAIADWLNSLGIHAFIERYRLRPYGSLTDALADTQRCFRVVRANAKEWGVDPNASGIMGFSAGGEQAAGGAQVRRGKGGCGGPRRAIQLPARLYRAGLCRLASVDLSNVPKKRAAGLFGLRRTRRRVSRRGVPSSFTTRTSRQKSP